jgi:hypothetical protein
MILSKFIIKLSLMFYFNSMEQSYYKIFFNILLQLTN